MQQWSILQHQGRNYRFLDWGVWQQQWPQLARLPFSLKVLLENVLRGGRQPAAELAQAFAERREVELDFSPARVLMQDFTGVPAVVDLAAMRDAMAARGGRVSKVNPFIPVDLVIDHSVMVDDFGSASSYQRNSELEYQRNGERYRFLKWGQHAFDNFRVVPPGTGICHQINLEYLAQVVWQQEVGPEEQQSQGARKGEILLYPDTLVGTDSHTTMINGLGVLGWGVGGIEAEAAMLGQSLSMLLPQVLGVQLSGSLPEGCTATDLVLTITQLLRKKGVVGKFVEFFGEGLEQLSLADMATISNMTPEFGATCGFFPVCQKTLDYLRLSGRSEEQVQLVEVYCRRQGLFWEKGVAAPQFDQLLSLDLATVEPSVAGPLRPQDRLSLSELPRTIARELGEKASAAAVRVADYQLRQGDIVLAAITSCTNTSNPQVMFAAGLLARKACQRGLASKPWVKTSLAPGSQVVSEYLKQAGLQTYLDQLGFNLVGYGCTTCIGNSGDLRPEVARAIHQHGITVAAVLSGNRNFEGRVHPEIKLNLLASPPLVVAYALAGTSQINLSRDPLGQDQQGRDVFLRDIWPSNEEISLAIKQVLSHEMFVKSYAQVFTGDQNWQAIKVTEGETYNWEAQSTYIQNPPYFNAQAKGQALKKPARILAILGDSVTTDHISPAGNISAQSPAAVYLREHGVAASDFNSYGARRGNHQVMMRGTFANIRLKNLLAAGKEGGYTRHIPSGQILSIYDAAMAYQQEGTPLVVVAGKDYGCGSSRDWAAKGTALLGVVAVLAESFERIHRSNLVGMAVLPLEFSSGQSQASLGLTGEEQLTLPPLTELQPRQKITLKLLRANGQEERLKVNCRIDTANELAYYRAGGILPYVLQQLQKQPVA